MKGLSGLCLLAGIATVLSVSQTLAQSGVLSGPPQIQPGPGARPEPGRRVQGPGERRQQDETWIAVVAGFDRSGQRVSVGYSGHHRSKPEAENAAIRACGDRDRTVTCQNPFAVSTGCLYIVPGNKRSGGVRWGRGGTREVAFDECRKGGYDCPSNKLVGGCVPGNR